MTRLPVVGGDIDQWGAILNDFLSVTFNPDGTLKSGEKVITDTTLSATTASLDLPGLVFPSTARMAKVLIRLQLTGISNGGSKWEHITGQVNADTTTDHYGWSGINSDITHVTSTPGSSAYTGTASILVGHGIDVSSSLPNPWGHIELEIPFPADITSVKTIRFKNQIIDNFTSYADVIPLQWMGTGFWIGPGAINEIKLTPVTGSFAAGTRAIVSYV